jgi:hypothetical protein
MLQEKEYVRSKIDSIVDVNYNNLASRCQTAHRGISSEYQAMLRDLGEHREAYRKAREALANTTKPPRTGSRGRASSRDEIEKSESSEKDVAVPITTLSNTNLFFGKVPKKTMAFETFTRIHEMELSAIGDPAQRHLTLSKKIKVDYAAQSAAVLRSADTALEDLRAMYFKRIIGMRDAFVNGYDTSSKRASSADSVANDATNLDSNV